MHQTLPIYETSVKIEDSLHIGYRGYVVALIEGRFLPLFSTYAKWDIREALKQLEEEKSKGDPTIATLAKVVYLIQQDERLRSGRDR